MEASSSFATGVAGERSQLYVGRGHHLVSDTNWEKGRIICQWRGELHDAGAPATEYSDEAWATRIGNVSSQHVGRLRRTFLRFGEVQSSYERLYWSHFQAAVEWTDAEMWLEGAVQNNWSVSDMRKARAETTGQAAETGLDAPAAEFDEDSAEDTGAVIAATPSLIADFNRADADEETAAEEFGDDTEHDTGHGTDAYDEDGGSLGDESRRESVPAPLASLPELPDDLMDAFEAFKLSILRHKLAGWADVAADDVIAALSALKQLVTAPSGE